MTAYRMTITDPDGNTIVQTEFDSDRVLVAPDATGHAVALQDECRLLIERVETAP